MPRMNVLLDRPAPNPEYVPAASQCQISTVAPLTGCHVRESTTANRSVNAVPGRPSVLLSRTFPPATSYGPSACSGARTHETASAASADSSPRHDFTAPRPSAAPSPPASRRSRPRVSGASMPWTLLLRPEKELSADLDDELVVVGGHREGVLVVDRKSVV